MALDFDAIDDGDVRNCRKLLSAAGADADAIVNNPITFSAGGQHTCVSPLMLAVLRRRYGIVRLLLKRGMTYTVDVHWSQPHTDMTVLWFGALKGRVEVVDCWPSLGPTLTRRRSEA